MRTKHSLARRILLVVLMGVVSVCGLRLASCGRGVRVGTFNIEQFGGRETDMDRLTDVVRATKADVLALQEIQSAEKMRDLARRLSVGGRRYAFRLSACGGKSKMNVGFLYDEARVAARDFSEYPELDPNGGGRCTDGDRPGFAATIDDGKRPFTVLVVHFHPGGDPQDLKRRKQQWQRAHVIAKQLRAGGMPVMILGDVNSTGFLDDKAGERTFIEAEAKKAEMDVVTRGLGCSEYWYPTKDRGTLMPSLLDHGVATPGLVGSNSARVHGYCEKLACAPAPRAPEDYENVSDHCPVTLDLTP